MDTTQMNQRLNDELKLVENELGELGVKNKETGEWETKVVDIDLTATEPNEIADRHEEYEEKSGEAVELQARREDILKALNKIKEGTYGICETCQNPIEEKRLEANPAAITCIAHA